MSITISHDHSPLHGAGGHLTRRRILSGAAAGAATAAGAGLLLQATLQPAAADPTSTDAAAVGNRQSPINIVPSQTTSVPDAPPLVVDYPTSTSLELEYVRRDTGSPGCSVRREDETVEAVNFNPNAVVRRDGERYRLLNTHFHIDSEHAVDGRKFAMEQHFVHERVSDGTLLVIGVFLVAGGNAPQDTLLANLPRECGQSIALENINLNQMLPSSLENWNYAGSLTTPSPQNPMPPFTEGVIWHVVRQPRAINAATIRRFAGLFPDGNSRGLQPRNGRPVRLIPGRRA